MLRKAFMIVVLLWGASATAAAADLSPINLPPPDTKGGRPLMQCLNDRKTDRSFAPRKLAPEILSNLLWAAAGINRPEKKGRTAPTAHNRQEIDVYVAMEEGLYLYAPESHSLRGVVKKDLRADTVHLFQPSRGSIANAPVQLIYVADYSKMGLASSEADKHFYAVADTGFISQNVYLYCASEGLATGVRAYFDKDALAKSVKLRDKQKVILVQAVGYAQ